MENDDLRTLNNIGDRIKWAREALGLNCYEVATSVGIPPSNYNGRESGIRTYYPEEYMLISEFFNQKWQEKFTKQYPEYNGNPIKKIHVLWIMFGIMGDL